MLPMLSDHFAYNNSKIRFWGFYIVVQIHGQGAVGSTDMAVEKIYMGWCLPNFIKI